MTTCKLLVGGASAVDLNDGTNIELLEYWPAVPKTEAHELDISAAIDDELTVLVKGSARDAWTEKVRAIEQVFAKLAYKREQGILTELQYSAPGAATALTTTVIEGELEYERVPPRAATVVNEKVVLRLRRLPYWQGTRATAITFATFPTDNGANNYAVIPALKGDMPVPLQAYLSMTGGNQANVKRIMAALRARGTPANFVHQYTAATMTAVTDTAISADGDFVGGQKARINTTNNTTGIVSLRQTVTSNVVDQYGRHFLALRVRDNKTGGANYKFRARGYVEDPSANRVYGPYASDWVQTPAVAGGTTEIASISLGILKVPAIGTEEIVCYGVGIELEAMSIDGNASNTCDVNMIALYPVGEAMAGEGLCLAEMPLALGANRYYLDGGGTTPPAFVTGTTNLMHSPASLYLGGHGIFAWPNQANQRLYFWLSREQAATGYGQHQANGTVVGTATYTPRYMSYAGTA